MFSALSYLESMMAIMLFFMDDKASVKLTLYAGAVFKTEGLRAFTKGCVNFSTYDIALARGFNSQVQL